MTINTVTATPDLVIEAISNLIKDPALRKMAPYLWGAPGIGKSQIVAQVAESVNYKLIDLRLTRMDSTDLTGLPYLHEESQQTIYYLPEFLPTQEMINEWGKDGAIIFLDELSAAEPRLQASAYELILDRRIGKYNLPDNVMVVAAGNRVEDGAIAYDLTSALSDRFIHFVVEASLESWLEWEKSRAKAGRPIAKEVKAFLQARPEFLDEGFKSTVADSEDKINPSPRSWERVSDLLDKVSNTNLRQIMVPGIIGAAAANEFFFVVEEIANLAPMSEYIKLGLAQDDEGLRNLLPNTIASLFGLGYSLPAYCTKADDFIGACYVLKVMSDIEDDKPRKEILVSSMITLFNKANKIDRKKLPREITRSKAYRIMREEHMKAFASIKDLEME